MVRNLWNGLPTFYKRLYESLEDPSMNSIISWGESNRSFIILNPKKLMHTDHYGKFHCCTLQSFLNRVNELGFKKVNKSKRLEFGHKEFFVRGKPELLRKLNDIVAARKRRNRCKAVKAKKAKKVVEE